MLGYLEFLRKTCFHLPLLPLLLDVALPLVRNPIIMYRKRHVYYTNRKRTDYSFNSCALLTTLNVQKRLKMGAVFV